MTTSKAKSPGVGEVLQEMFANTLSALVEQGELPKNDSVQHAGVHLMFAMLNEWFEGTSPTAKALDALFERLRDEEDETMRRLGVMERQAVWGTLSMLNQERKRRKQIVRP